MFQTSTDLRGLLCFKVGLEGREIQKLFLYGGRVQEILSKAVNDLLTLLSKSLLLIGQMDFQS